MKNREELLGTAARAPVAMCAAGLDRGCYRPNGMRLSRVAFSGCKLGRLWALAFMVAVLWVAETSGAPRFRLPLEGEVNRLFEAAARWTPAADPRNPRMRFVVYTTLTKAADSRENISSMVGKFFEGRMEERPKMERDAIIRNNIERIVSEQTKLDHYKRQLFMSGHKYRLDQLFRLDGTQIDRGNTNYMQSWVVLGDVYAGDYLSHSYQPRDKIVTIDDKRGKIVANPGLWEAGVFDAQTRAFFEAALIDPEDIRRRQNAGMKMMTAFQKAERAQILKLTKGIHETLKLEIADGMLGSAEVSIFRMSWAKHKSTIFTLFCDKADYSRIFRHEVTNMKSGKVEKLKEFGDYREDGFPRSFTVTSNAGAENEVKEAHRFEAVDLVGEFDDEEVFGLRAAMNWTIVDARPETIVATFNGEPVIVKSPSKTKSPQQLKREARKKRRPIMFIILSLSLLAILVKLRR